ncbi:AMP-binding enzyme family protein [Mycobacterium xenopi 4042]|uniref:AMP-binding enzyme family protein n=1 Tax=Mycobacterium xenopi 4042 TaxID=1299334 RepID=X7ZVH7_MYCXE|nr:AMP-binding enzyme family protein [Mycobacterium xenopi 4042]
MSSQHTQPITVLDTFRNIVAAGPDHPSLIYFDTVLTLADIDRMTSALAAALADKGFSVGDRLGLYMQNVPQYVIGLIAAWKLGGIAVPVNPMLKPAEVSGLLADSAPAVLLALSELHSPELVEMLVNSPVRHVITTGIQWPAAGDDELGALIAQYDGRVPPMMTPALDDAAVISYTSGTTGKPKGAVNTHRNIATGGHAYRKWFELDEKDVVLGVAPLFHVTGLTGHLACAVVAGAPLVLCYRFSPDVVLAMIRRHKPTFTVGRSPPSMRSPRHLPPQKTTLRR